MCFTQSISSFEGFPSGSDYVTIKQLLESDFGLTNNRYDRDLWADTSPEENSITSLTTPTTKSSSVTKYSPTHYKRGTIEIWDFIVDQGLDYLAGNVIKYVCRAGHKSHESELDDWLKAKAYVDRKIQQLSHERNR
jgi:hypothetical protein